MCESTRRGAPRRYSSRSTRSQRRELCRGRAETLWASSCSARATGTVKSVRRVRQASPSSTRRPHAGPIRQRVGRAEQMQRLRPAAVPMAGLRAPKQTAVLTANETCTPSRAARADSARVLSESRDDRATGYQQRTAAPTAAGRSPKRENLPNPTAAKSKSGIIKRRGHSIAKYENTTSILF